MSKKTKFIYNGILLTLVGFAMRAAGLFLGAYISGAIGAEGVGLNSLISTAYSFAVTFATSGVSLSVTRLVASAIGEAKSDDAARMLRGAFIYALVFGISAAALLFTLSGFIGKYLLCDARTASALRVLSLSLPAIALSSVISGYFVAVRRVTLNAAVQVAGQLARIVLTVILLLRLSSYGAGYAILAIALGTTATELICLVISLVELFFDRRIYQSTAVRGYAVAPVAKMALPLALSAYVRSFLLTVEHSLIPRKLIERGNSPSDALASYGYLHGMALPIILFPMTPLSSFSGLLVPEFAESEGAKNSARMSRIASEALSKTLMYATAAAVFIYLFSEEIGYAVYGSFESGLYISLLAPVIPIMYLDHVTDSILKGIGEHVYSMWVNIADSFLSVILVWLLIPSLDIFGYAVVIVLMELFNFTLSFIRLRRRISFRLPLFRSVMLPFAAAAASSVLVQELFRAGGSAVTPVLLAVKVAFALSAFICIMMIVNRVFNTYKQTNVVKNN